MQHPTWLLPFPGWIPPSSTPVLPGKVPTDMPQEPGRILGSLGHAGKFLAARDNHVGSAVPDYWERIKATAENSPSSRSCFKHIALLRSLAREKTDSSTFSLKKNIFCKKPHQTNQPNKKFHKPTTKPNSLGLGQELGRKGCHHPAPSFSSYGTQWVMPCSRDISKHSAPNSAAEEDL